MSHIQAWLLLICFVLSVLRQHPNSLSTVFSVVVPVWGRPAPMTRGSAPCATARRTCGSSDACSARRAVGDVRRPRRTLVYRHHEHRARLARMLLERGAGVDLGGFTGGTALMDAASAGHAVTITATTTTGSRACRAS